MSLLWLLLFIPLYFIIGSFLAGIMTRLSDDFDDDDVLFFTVIFWPIVVPFMLVAVICIKIINYFRA